jgi:hypothetical protein
VLFNAILAARPPDSDGDYFYYSTYSAAAKKVFYPSKWPCCSGTLVQTAADYPLNIYFASDDGLYVTLYAPSRLRFTHHGGAVQIEQQTGFPAEDTAALTFTLEHPTALTLWLRLPAWLVHPASLRLNGKTMPLSASRGSFAALHRTWRNGDRVEVTLPQDFRTEPIDELHPDTVALLRGPVQYVAIDSSNQPTRERRLLPADLRKIGPETFVANYAEQEIVFVPLRVISNESYTSYFSKA